LSARVLFSGPLSCGFNRHCAIVTFPGRTFERRLNAMGSAVKIGPVSSCNALGVDLIDLPKSICY
jgi:hypothetical protein